MYHNLRLLQEERLSKLLVQVTGTHWTVRVKRLHKLQSIEVGTVSVVEDIKKRLHQDLLGVKPTKLCTCTEKVSRESKFVKFFAAATTLVDGRIHSSGDAVERRRTSQMKSLRHRTEKDVFYRKSFLKNGRRGSPNLKLLDQNFVTKVPPAQIDRYKPKWYLPLQAVFTPESSTKA